MKVKTLNQSHTRPCTSFTKGSETFAHIPSSNSLHKHMANSSQKQLGIYSNQSDEKLQLNHMTSEKKTKSLANTKNDFMRQIPSSYQLTRNQSKNDVKMAMGESTLQSDTDKANPYNLNLGFSSNQRNSQQHTR